MLLGAAETIGRQADLFDTVSKKWRLYRRLGPASHASAGLPLERLAELPRMKPLETPFAPPLANRTRN